LGPADARSQRLELREARDYRIADLAWLDQLDAASAARHFPQCNLEVEPADPAHDDFAVERDTAATAALVGWIACFIGLPDRSWN
jgi:hypothetical protein